MTAGTPPFHARDAGVRAIAAVFALSGWEWGGWGERLAYVPGAGDIADTLNRLYDNVRLLGEGGEGSSSSGRLWVEIGRDSDGDSVGYGIAWSLDDDA